MREMTYTEMYLFTLRDSEMHSSMPEFILQKKYMNAFTCWHTGVATTRLSDHIACFHILAVHVNFSPPSIFTMILSFVTICITVAIVPASRRMSTVSIGHTSRTRSPNVSFSCSRSACACACTVPVVNISSASASTTHIYQNPVKRCFE